MFVRGLLFGSGAALGAALAFVAVVLAVAVLAWGAKVMLRGLRV